MEILFVVYSSYLDVKTMIITEISFKIWKIEIEIIKLFSDDICNEKQVQNYNNHFREDFGTDGPLSLFRKENADHWPNTCDSDNTKTKFIDVDVNEGQGMDYLYDTFDNGKGCNRTKKNYLNPILSI